MKKMMVNYGGIIIFYIVIILGILYLSTPNASIKSENVNISTSSITLK